MRKQAMCWISTIFVLMIGLGGLGAEAASFREKARIKAIIIEEAHRYSVEPELVLAVAKVESNFDATAVSPKGARGVMQIMPQTALQEFGVAAHRLFDARTNIQIGIRYLKHLLVQYGYRRDIALSHYNGGSKVRGDDGHLAVIPATRGYVDKVLTLVATFQDHVAGPAKGLYAYRVDSLDDFGSIGHYTGDTGEASFYIRSNNNRQVDSLRRLRYHNMTRGNRQIDTAPRPIRRQSLSYLEKLAQVRAWENYDRRY